MHWLSASESLVVKALDYWAEDCFKPRITTLSLPRPLSKALNTVKICKWDKCKTLWITAFGKFCKCKCIIICAEKIAKTWKPSLLQFFIFPTKSWLWCNSLNVYAFYLLVPICDHHLVVGYISVSEADTSLTTFQMFREGSLSTVYH